jgi:hypothetical protein
MSSVRGLPHRSPVSPMLLDSEEGAPLTADAVLSTLEYSGERGDDPAGYFFPDSETLTASASD